MSLPTLLSCSHAARVAALLADPIARLTPELAAHLPGCPICRERAAEAIRNWPTDRSPSPSLPEWLSAPSGVATLSPFQAEAVARGRADDLDLGPYLLLDRLGAGGMGEVYRAWHRLLRREDAVKRIRPGMAQTPAAVARFLREAAAAAKLNHPNVVRVYTADRAADGYYLAMEYVPGSDLARVLRDSGVLPVSTACEYVRQAAEGLHHAFVHGLVHRDVKPANLLLSQDGHTVKVTDFGLARAFEPDPADGDHHTATGAILGTPHFMSPEQVEDSRHADTRSDVYSLGCTLFYLLTGRPPFHGSAGMELCRKHASTPPPAIRSLRSDVPATVEAIVAKALAKRPEDRFQTPGEMAAALREVAYGAITQPRSQLPTPEPLPLPDESTTAWSPATVPEHREPTPPARRKTSKRMWLWAVAGVLVLGSAVALVMHFTRDRNPPDLAKTDPPKTEPKDNPQPPPAGKQPAVQARPNAPLPKPGNSGSGPWVFAGVCSSDRTDKVRVVGVLQDGTIVGGREGLRQDGKDVGTWECWPREGGGKPLWSGLPVGTKEYEYPVGVHPTGQLLTDRFRRFAPPKLAALPPLASDLAKFGGGNAEGIDNKIVTTGDERYLAAVTTPEGGGGRKFRVVVLWEAETGKVRTGWQVKTDSDILAVAADRTGDSVAFGTREGKVGVVSTRTGGERLWTAPNSSEGKPDPVSAIAITPNGKTVYSAHAVNGTIEVWDAVGDRRVTCLHLGWQAFSLAISPDGRWLVAAGYAVTVWDLNENPPKSFELAEHWAGELMSAVFSPDGKRLVVGGWARREKETDGEGVVWLWELKP